MSQLMFADTLNNHSTFESERAAYDAMCMPKKHWYPVYNSDGHTIGEIELISQFEPDN